MTNDTGKGKSLDTPTYSMPRELADAVRRVAESEEVPASHIVRAALKKYPPIQRALAAARRTPAAA